MSIRLAVVVNRFPAVSETFIFNKVIQLKKAGFDVDVFVHQRENDLHLFRERIDDPGLRYVKSAATEGGKIRIIARLLKSVILFPRRSINLFFSSARYYGWSYQAFKAWALALPFEKGNYNIVHLEFSGIAITYMNCMPLLPRVRFLTSCRGAAEKILPLTEPARADQLRKLFPLLHAVHCVSIDMQKTVEKYGLDPAKAFINYPAIDTKSFSREEADWHINKGEIILLSVGRLHWKKGLEYAILAVKKIVDQGYPVVYRIIGGGEEEERLRFAISDLELDKSVRLVGSKPAEVVKKELQTADIFLLPSLSEGLSNSLLEAMAMELPVVSTAAGGMAEAVTSGVEGYLVPTRDPVQLAEKIAYLIENPAVRREMGQNGRKKVEAKFNLESQTSIFATAYRKIMEFDS